MGDSKCLSPVTVALIGPYVVDELERHGDDVLGFDLTDGILTCAIL